MELLEYYGVDPTVEDNLVFPNSICNSWYLSSSLEEGFERVLVKSLDKTLGSFNVERQAYHGGSFIGNHVHRAQ